MSRFTGRVRQTPNRGYTFIQPDTGEDDIYLHVSKLRDGEQASDLLPDTRVSFRLGQPKDGQSLPAVDVEVIEVPKIMPRPSHRDVEGTVKYWHSNGYGFVKTANGEAFVHASNMSDGDYLAAGDDVTLKVTKGKKGLEGHHVTFRGRTTTGDQFADLLDMGPPGKWPEDLAKLADEEEWGYRRAKEPESLPVLRSYIKYTFLRAHDTDRFVVTDDKRFAAFNTGLVTDLQQEIFAVFGRGLRRQWKLSAFRIASDRELLQHFGGCLPPLVEYFDDPSELLYDRRRELAVNVHHVVRDNIDRFPKDLTSNEHVLLGMLEGAKAATQLRVYRNYKAAIPQFYRGGPDNGTIQLLLPLCLRVQNKADLALVISRVGEAYRGDTVLTLDMAYNNARLLTRPDSEWLAP